MAIQETDGYGKMMALIARQQQVEPVVGIAVLPPPIEPAIAKTLPHEVALQAHIIAKINWQNRGS